MGTLICILVIWALFSCVFLQTKYSYLDVVGRTVVVLEKKNVVPVHNIPFQVIFSPFCIHFCSIDFIFSFLSLTHFVSVEWFKYSLLGKHILQHMLTWLNLFFCCEFELMGCKQELLEAPCTLLCFRFLVFGYHCFTVMSLCMFLQFTTYYNISSFWLWLRVPASGPLIVLFSHVFSQIGGH